MRKVTQVRFTARGLVMAAVIWGMLGTAGAVLAPDLSNVIVYPNPFDVRLGHSVITFDNLTASGTLRVYKLTGELVFEKDFVSVDGKAVWDGTNTDGNHLASGLYMYLVTNDNGQKKTGKIAILR